MRAVHSPGSQENLAGGQAYVETGGYRGWEVARGRLTRLPILGEDDSMCRSQMQRRRHGWGIRGC